MVLPAAEYRGGIWHDDKKDLEIDHDIEVVGAPHACTACCRLSCHQPDSRYLLHNLEYPWVMMDGVNVQAGVKRTALSFGRSATAGKP